VTVSAPARAATPAARLRTLLAGAAAEAPPRCIVMPGCFDAMSAALVRQAGYPVGFMSGFSVSAARLGQPDTGLISFGEMLDSLRAVTDAASPETLVIADGDTGYGNALNVQRTVREYARAGAACVMIEDQVAPKRCGHTKGKQVVGRAEARTRIRAAVDAREQGPDILIMARTDARATDGFDEALERCHAFVEEGADIIFLEAPTSEDEMRRFCAEIERPTMANMIDGGRTPILTIDQLGDIGYRLAAYPLALLAASIAAMQQTLDALRPDAQAAGTPRRTDLTFEQLQAAVGFPAYWDAEERYRID
jgi:2-methylisocitrate lyase-like PEP mutase family enzyme